MKKLSHIKLTYAEQAAVMALKTMLSDIMPISQVILFGSKARGDSSPESDIDMLLLLNKSIDNDLREAISSIKYDIELKYDIVISLIIENESSWQSNLSKAMPLHWNIEREGVII